MNEAIQKNENNQSEDDLFYKAIRKDYEDKLLSFLDSFKNIDFDSPDYDDLTDQIEIFMVQLISSALEECIPSDILYRVARFATFVGMSKLSRLMKGGNKEVQLEILPSYLSHNLYASVYKEITFKHPKDDLQKSLLLLLAKVYARRPEIAVYYYEKLGSEEYKDEINKLENESDNVSDKLDILACEEIMTMTKAILTKNESDYSKESLAVRLKQIVDDLKLVN